MTSRHVPTPGIDKSYRGACAVCMRGTDTGLAFTASAEWIIVALTKLGIPLEEATSMLSDVTGNPPGFVPIGTFTLPVRVCKACAKKTGRFEVGIFQTGAPNYEPN